MTERDPQRHTFRIGDRTNDTSPPRRDREENPNADENPQERFVWQDGDIEITHDPYATGERTPQKPRVVRNGENEPRRNQLEE